jgi:integrase
MFYGFLHREGTRRSEAGAMTWSDFDLLRGVVVLDENKTNDPRAWALSPGVAEALQAWRELRARNGMDVVTTRRYSWTTRENPSAGGWRISIASICARRESRGRSCSSKARAGNADSAS